MEQFYNRTAENVAKEMGTDRTRGLKKDEIAARLEKYGKIAHREMFNIFNMGIGMVLALDESEASKAISILESHGEKASVIGRITDSEGVNIIGSK